MKERLDVILVNKGLADSREKAKRTIMAGLVKVEGRVEDKPGSVFDTESDITVEGKECPYVSRGGLKLEKGIAEWNIDCKGKVCVDMGASTGGFTDCMLQHGASKVYAIDVGPIQSQQGVPSGNLAAICCKIGFTKGHACTEPPGIIDGPCNAPISPPEIPVPTK